MSSVIKADATGLATRTLPIPQLVALPDPELDRLRRSLEAATAEIGKLKADLVKAEESHAKREWDAHEAGLKAGKALVMEDTERRLAAIVDAAELARAAWDQRLAELDGLAAMLARAALAKMFGECDDLAGLVARAIAVQFDKLHNESRIEIRVSDRDFSDDQATERLAAQVGRGRVSVVRDPKLGSGDCRLALQLGEMDAGIAAQWQRLDRFLAGLMGDAKR